MHPAMSKFLLVPEFSHLSVFKLVIKLEVKFGTNFA